MATSITLPAAYWSQILGAGGSGAGPVPSPIGHTMEVLGYNPNPAGVERVEVRDASGQVVGSYMSFKMVGTAEFANYSGDITDSRYRAALGYYNSNFNYYHYNNSELRQNLLRSTTIADQINDLSLRDKRYNQLVKDGAQRSKEWITASYQQEYAQRQKDASMKEFLKEAVGTSPEELKKNLHKAAEQAKKLGLSLNAIAKKIDEELTALKTGPSPGGTGGSGTGGSGGSSISARMEINDGWLKLIMLGQMSVSSQNLQDHASGAMAIDYMLQDAKQREGFTVGSADGKFVPIYYDASTESWYIDRDDSSDLRDIFEAWQDHARAASLQYNQQAEMIDTMVKDMANVGRDIYMDKRNISLDVNRGLEAVRQAEKDFEHKLLARLTDEQKTQFLSYFSDLQDADGDPDNEYPTESARYHLMTDLEGLSAALSATNDPAIREAVRQTALEIWKDYVTSDWAIAGQSGSLTSIFYDGIRVTVDGREQIADGFTILESLLVQGPKVGAGAIGDVGAAVIERSNDKIPTALPKAVVNGFMGGFERTSKIMDAAWLSDSHTHMTTSQETFIWSTAKSVANLIAVSKTYVDKDGATQYVYASEAKKFTNDAKGIEWVTEQTRNNFGKALSNPTSSAAMESDTASWIENLMGTNAFTSSQAIFVAGMSAGEGNLGSFIAAGDDLSKQSAVAWKAAWAATGDYLAKDWEKSIVDWKMEIYRDLSESRAMGRNAEDDQIFGNYGHLTVNQQDTVYSTSQALQAGEVEIPDGELGEINSGTTFEDKWTRAEIPQDIFDLMPTVAEGLEWKNKLETIEIGGRLWKDVPPAERISLTLSTIYDCVNVLLYVQRDSTGKVTSAGLAHAKTMIAELRTLLAGLTSDLDLIHAGINVPLPEDWPAGTPFNATSRALYVLLDRITQVTSLSLNQSIKPTDAVLISQVQEAMAGVGAGEKLVFNLVLYATDDVAAQFDNRLTNIYGDIAVTSTNADGSTETLNGTIGGAVWRDQNGKFHYTGAGDGSVIILGNYHLKLEDLVWLADHQGSSAGTGVTEEYMRKYITLYGAATKIWDALNQDEKTAAVTAHQAFLNSVSEALGNASYFQEILTSAKAYWAYLQANRTDSGARELWHQNGFKAEDNNDNVFGRALSYGIDIEQEVSAIRYAIQMNGDGAATDLDLPGRGTVYAVNANGEEGILHARLENGLWYSKFNVQVGAGETAEGYEAWRPAFSGVTGALTFIRMLLDADGNFLRAERYNLAGELSNEMGDAITADGFPVYLTIRGEEGYYDRVTGQKAVRHVFTAAELGAAEGGVRWGVQVKQADGTMKWSVVSDQYLIQHPGGSARYNLHAAVMIDAASRPVLDALLEWSGLQSTGFEGYREIDGVTYYGGGNDNVTGDSGGVRANDILDGGDGNDSINGVSGNDQIYGQGGDDKLWGGAGDDSVFGGFGKDLVYGGDGADKLWGDGDDDILWGGEGRDTLLGGSGNDRLNGDAGEDSLDGDAGDDTLSGGSGDDVIRAGAGNDLVTAERGTNIVDGGAGNDTLSGGLDRDLIFGGSGHDVIHGDVATVEDVTNNATSASSNDSLYGGYGNDSISGYAGEDHIVGQDGNDTLDGGQGDDTLDGGFGNDVLSGGDGNDVLSTGRQMNDAPTSDRITGGVGDDTLIVSSGRLFSAATLEGGSGRDVFILQGDRAFESAGGLYDGMGYNGVSGGMIRINDFDYGEVFRTQDIQQADLSFWGFATDANGERCFRLVDKKNRTTSIYFTGVWEAELAYSWVNGTLQIVRKGGSYTGDGWEVQTPWTDQTASYGNEGSDTLKGSDDADVIFGYGGNDDIKAFAGDDSLYGGEGWDRMDGGSGNDFLSGEDGSDVLSGGYGDDVIYGGDGLDEINGGEGNDVLFGGRGNDRLTADFGNDEVHGDDGNDYISDDVSHIIGDGGEGNDSFYGGAGNDYLVGSHGSNLLDGGEGNDSVVSGVSVDILLGGDGDDTLKGGQGADTLSGGSGNDALYGEQGDDSLRGGEGDDLLDDETSATLSVRNASGNDWMNGEDGNDTLRGRDGHDRLYGGSGNDNLDGGADNDYLSGDEGNDTLEGGAGDDVLQGGVGLDILNGGAGYDSLEGGEEADQLHGGSEIDTLYGGNGADSLYGGAGNDRLYGGSDNDVLDDADNGVMGGNDILDGGAGDDLLLGRDGDDILNGGAGADTFDGGDGYDTVDFLLASPVSLDLSRTSGAQGLVGDALGDVYRNIEAFSLSLGNDTLIGSAQADIVYGNSGADNLEGMGGADVLNGGFGADTLIGGADNDMLLGGEGDDALYGGAGDDLLDDATPGSAEGNTVYGNDVMEGGDGNDRIYGRFGNDTLDGGEGNDLIDAGEDDDIVYGRGGNDTILGYSGADYLFGMEGNDTVDGGAGNDYIGGYIGNDALYGASGDDTLKGEDGNDYLHGGEGHDTLYGGDGDDYIVAGLGRNQLYGGSGNDTFEFDAYSPYDGYSHTINDFSAGDVIKILGVTPTIERTTTYYYVHNNTGEVYEGDPRDMPIGMYTKVTQSSTRIYIGASASDHHGIIYLQGYQGYVYWNAATSTLTTSP